MAVGEGSEGSGGSKITAKLFSVQELGTNGISPVSAEGWLQTNDGFHRR